MSIEAMKWALDEMIERDLDMPQRFLLLMLANGADHRGGNLYPSHGYLARRTGMGKSTVRAHLITLERIGLLSKAPRKRDHDGSQTSNMYQLAMRQSGLDLDEIPPPLPESSTPPHASRSAPRVPAAASRPPASRASTRELGEVKGRKRTPAGGAIGPSPVAQCWQIYSAGMKKRYGIDYPGSAKVNGQLSQLVARLGADNAKLVTQAYVDSDDPWYVKVAHEPGYLLRDAAKILITVSRRTGGMLTVTKAQASLQYESGTESALTSYPVDDAERIARKVLNDYGGKIAGSKPKNIVITAGSQRHVFSIEELRARA